MDWTHNATISWYLNCSVQSNLFWNALLTHFIHWKRDTPTSFIDSYFCLYPLWHRKRHFCMIKRQMSWISKQMDNCLFFLQFRQNGEYFYSNETNTFNTHCFYCRLNKEIGTKLMISLGKIKSDEFTDFISCFLLFSFKDSIEEINNFCSRYAEFA